MSYRLRKQILAELEQLHRLVEVHRPLLDRGPDAPPSAVEVSALGALLHSFYNGVENIFKRIALELDGELPRTASWHRDLLESMARPARNRTAVISEPVRERCKEYLAFRHGFRSAYSFLLEWERMAPLVLDCQGILDQLEAEVLAFLDALPAH